MRLSLQLGRATLELRGRWRPRAGRDPAPPGRPPEGPVTIDAPMGGVVQALAVRPGDRVQAGQAVAIIGAYEIESTVAGRVVEPLVAPGAAVTAGQPLLALAPEGPP